MRDDIDDYVPPEPVPPRLHPTHVAYREEFYVDVPEDVFIRNVCHSTQVIAEKGIQPVQHVPCKSVVVPGLDGWYPAGVLIVAPNPVGGESMYETALPVGIRQCKFLRDELEAAGIPLREVAVTHAVRFMHPDNTAYSQAHKTANAVYALEDVKQIRPKVVITLGAAALRALFGQKAKLDSVRGDTLHLDGIPVVPTASHLQFMSGYGDIDVFRAELRKAAELLFGLNNKASVDESGYRVVSTLDELLQLEKDIVPDEFLAFDFEFGNDVAREEFNYPLSLQLSWAEGKAAFIKLRNEGGAVLYSDTDMVAVVACIKRILTRTDCELAGQHIRVDVDVAHKLGIDIDDRIETSFDTMLAHHALYGDSSQGLDHLTRKYCPWFGAYWRQLEDWLDANERKKSLQFGYRNIPYDILIPYGLRDADVTWRIAKKLREELENQPALNSYFRDIAMPAALHLLDVQRQGILVDEDRRTQIRVRLQPAYDKIMEKLRKAINWPSFNPGSKDNVASLLFSKAVYKNKKAAPEGARVFDLQPLMNTDKYPKQWTDIVAEGLEERNAPSTKATTIETLYGKYKIPELKWLKQLSVLGKFLSSYVAPKELNEFDVLKDGKSFENAIGADGRVRTHLWQTSETGRLRSTACNLQNSPKKQEEAILEAIVDLEKEMPIAEYKLRTNSKKCPAEELIPFEERIVLDTFKSCYIAPTDHVLIEADFKTAEICVWAFVSGDIALCKLLEQQRDIHSEIAVTAFQLPEQATLVKALEQLNSGDRSAYDAFVERFKKEQGALRITAKAILFGIIYSRSAGALAREMMRLGVDSDVEQCQRIINSIASTFPTAWEWIKSNQAFAVANGYLATVFGNRRYFSGSTDLSESAQASIKREAANGPIQSCIFVDERILTPTGLRSLSSMPIGSVQRVVVNGKEHDATVIYNGVRDTIEVTSDNGASLRCTPDHRLLVVTEHGEEWKQAGELKPGDVLVWHKPPVAVDNLTITASTNYVRSNARFNRSITTELDCDLGWLCGFCLGDGSWAKASSNISFVCRTDEHDPIDNVKRILNKLDIPFQASVCQVTMSHHIPLEKVNVSHGILKCVFNEIGLTSVHHNEMVVPALIWNSPPSVQLAFLDGYFTADGTVSKFGVITWVTASEALNRDIKNLMAGLGVTVRSFLDGKGYTRGSCNPHTNAEFLAAMFRAHKRKRDWLFARRSKNSRSNYVMQKSMPSWLVKQCLPDMTPPPGSAQTIYHRAKRGGPLSLDTCNRLKSVGFKPPVNVALVESTKACDPAPVYDLSIHTDTEESRRFTVNGFTAHNCVAMLALRAGINLYRTRYRTTIGRKVGFKVLLPIHDAFLVEVHKDYVKETDMILTKCMSTMNKIPGTDYCLGVDIEHYVRWGVH